MKKIALIVMFFALMFAPLAQMALHIIGEEPVVENRPLAPAPTVSANLHDLVQSSGQWFTDHFGLRPSLIRLKTQVDYSLFGVSDRVHIGKDDWLFYRSVIDVEQPAMATYLREHRAQVLNGISAFTDALRRRGIQPIFVSNELADRFYPDMLPSGVPPRTQDFEDFVELLKRIDGLNVIPTTEILRDTAHSRLIFHKTDFHWNDPAAFTVAEEIVRQASLDEGRPSPWHQTLKITSAPLSGGVANFMPLFVAPHEMSLFVEQNWQMPTGYSQQPGPPPFDFSTKISGENAELLGPIVVAGDSFSDAFVRCGMLNFFTESYNVRFSKIPKLSDFAAQLPPDTRHVVFQMIEVQFSAVSKFADAEDVRKAVAILDARPD